MKLTVPEFSLVALMGASGSGKSTFAREHFLATEVLSSDTFRGLVADDEGDQSATRDAFDALHHVARIRLARRRLTVLDATHAQREDRRRIVALAREYHCLPVAIVLDLDTALCQERNRNRSNRTLPRHVVRNQSRQIRKALRGLKREGFRYIHVLSDPEAVAAAEIERQKLWTDRRDETGPFDIVGDVHGCHDELVDLLERLGWKRDPTLHHPEGRKLVFLGDLVDRGPKTPEVLRLVMEACAEGQALCVPGNHDVKLVRALRGQRVSTGHGLDRSIEQLAAETPEFRERVVAFLDGLISHYELDDGRLVVAHAGMREDMQGRASAAVRSFALFGETTGETDEMGLPVRHDWAREYRGPSKVVYGHTPIPEVEWLNGTVNLDTGCVFGGRLTALRYPEEELVSVPARAVYAEPVRPFAAATDGRSAQQAHDDLLDIDDYRGKLLISTRHRGRLTLREENTTAALEAMSRFGADPRWLVYLPPTMAPSETSELEGFLEHPEQSLGYFEAMGVRRVICQEKHMGSRAVVVICRDEDTALERFGVDTGEVGICHTRTGRRFFEQPEMESELLNRVRKAFDATGLWDELGSSWAVLDCELMPWSVKAQKLLREQYAAVGSAAVASLDFATDLLAESTNQALAEDPTVSRLASDLARRRDHLEHYRAAYRHYCWPVDSVTDLRLAPFHLLASEGAVHTDKNHLWHLSLAVRLREAGDEVLTVTDSLQVDLEDPKSRDAAVDWWTARTARGSEGMVVKPLDFLVRGQRGLIQPALKCRGREYLRIIYGPEYPEKRHLDRLRKRHLGRKRSLALRELALGLEALERFVAGEPLRRVHECVFGVLALESEPVDPRL